MDPLLTSLSSDAANRRFLGMFRKSRSAINDKNDSRHMQKVMKFVNKCNSSESLGTECDQATQFF